MATIRDPFIILRDWVAGFCSRLFCSLVCLLVCSYTSKLSVLLTGSDGISTGSDGLTVSVLRITHLPLSAQTRRLLSLSLHTAMWHRCVTVHFFIETAVLLKLVLFFLFARNNKYIRTGEKAPNPYLNYITTPSLKFWSNDFSKGPRVCVCVQCAIIHRKINFTRELFNNAKMSSTLC